MTLQVRLLRRLRRWTLLLALAGGAYLGLRFETISLPEDRCCPVNRFGAGDRLIVDRHPPSVGPGDAVLVRGKEGALHLVVVSATREGGAFLWCSSDCPDCTGFDSAVDGWVEQAAISGRVLLGWVY
ncbi:MAG: hypothetical protein P8M11_13570 [Planctomycetota bacterium]|nr:hypothetical protein [Planctomycetota bacterium]MDG1985585.1 hypothetical protein [Planctomycetota bacterium]